MLRFRRLAGECSDAHSATQIKYRQSISAPFLFFAVGASGNGGTTLSSEMIALLLPVPLQHVRQSEAFLWKASLPEADIHVAEAWCTLIANAM
jgi:hypothetical protein